MQLSHPGTVAHQKPAAVRSRAYDRLQRCRLTPRLLQRVADRRAENNIKQTATSSGQLSEGRPPNAETDSRGTVALSAALATDKVQNIIQVGSTDLQGSVYKHSTLFERLAEAPIVQHVHCVHHCVHLPTLDIPRVKTVLASRAFRSAAPTIWNSLPRHILSCSTLTSFRQHLKTHFFNIAFDHLIPVHR